MGGGGVAYSPCHLLYFLINMILFEFSFRIVVLVFRVSKLGVQVIMVSEILGKRLESLSHWGHGMPAILWMNNIR